MRGRYIKPNDRCETLQQFIAFDTETKPETIDRDTVSHHLWFGYAAFVRRLPSGKWSTPDWCRFEDIHTFWRWVESKARAKTKTYLLCHNTNFDLPVLDAFMELPKRGWSPDRLVIEAPPTMFSASE